MTTKGLTKVDDNPDLLVGYQVAIGTEKQFTSYNSNWGYGPRSGIEEAGMATLAV